MADFKGIQEQYDDINQVGSRPVGLMTEFTTEAGRPIYISHNGEIVSEKSTTIPYNGKYVNVPSIHDGIEYSEFELIKLLDEKKIKPTSTHKTQELAVKAAQKRSPSLMSEETARAVESKYWREMTKRKATADQILGDSSTELVTPDAKAESRMDDLQAIQEDEFLDLYGEGEKSQKLDAYMSTLSEDDKSDIQSYLDKPTPKINSIEGDEAMAKGRARRNDVDETVTAFYEGGYEDGGLKDEGGTVDPVSGNEVPSGSTQSEVRDDIPAQLSEGEFVLPADVVRYIGLENLMELRNKAKQGLQQMEDMGQMGNSEEAIMPDTAEMEVDIDAMIDEFDPNDPATMEFSEGGVVKAQAGALINAQMPQQQQFSYGYQPPQQQMGYQPPQVPQTQFPNYSQFVSQPAQAAVGQQQQGITEQRQYIGPNGELITIMFIDGKPQQEIPAGYKVYKPEEEKPTVAQPQVRPTDTGGGDGPEPDNRTQLEKDMARTEPKTRDVAEDLIDNLTDPEAKKKVQAQLDKLNSAVKAAYAAPFASMIPGVGFGIAGSLVRNAIKEDNAMDSLIKEVSGLSTRQYRDEQLIRTVADEGLSDTVRDMMEQQFGSGYLDSDELDALQNRSEQERIDSFNQIVRDAGQSNLQITSDDSRADDSGLTSTRDLGGSGGFTGDRGVDENRGPGGQRSGGDRDSNDNSGGFGNDSDADGGSFGSPSGWD